MENQVDFKILPSDQFNVYSPATRSDKIITYFTLLSKLRGDILTVSSQDDPNNIVSAYYTNTGGTQTLHLIKADGSEVTASQPQQVISGTVNYVSKFTTSNDIGNSQIFDDGTNVGIGTTSMTHKLQLGTGGVFADYYQLDTTYSNGFVVGAISWDSDNGTADIGLSGSLKLKIGQDDVWYVKNQTGSPITKGTAVYASGTLGASGRILVSPMIANGTIPARFFLGVVAETIANGADGYVMAKGKIRQINTNAYNEGDVLWVSPTTAGALTATEPTAPNLKLAVAFVVHKNTNGVLAIRSTTGTRIADASDVEYSGAADNSFLVYNSSTGVWEDETIGIFKTIAVAGQSNVVADAYDDTLTLVAGTNVTITTNASTDTITINATDQYVGTVTSVDMSVPTGFAISGNPITTSGTLALAFASGYSLPTNALQTNWTDAYNDKINSASFDAATGVITLTQQDAGTVTVDIDGRFILLSEKGAANGVATLDSGGKIPTSQLPSSVFEYKGTWNAATNTPTLANGTGDAGDVYRCTVAGTVNFGAGPITFGIGDLVIYDGTEWQKSDSTDAVTSVNGYTGTVVLTTTDIAEGTNLYFTTARARQSVSAGAGITYNNSTGVITNDAPDQTVVLTGAGTTVVTGAYPNFTITSNDQFVGTVTSVNLTAGTGIAVSGGPITTNGSITVTNNDRGSSQNIFKNIDVAGQSTIVADNNDDTLTVAAGTGITLTTNATTDTLTITNNAPDQTVVLTGAGTTVITGTYPSFTITSNDQYAGTVTSVDMSVPTGFAISGNPITTSGTLALAFASGYSLPTNASQTNWDTAYNDSITAFAYNTANGVLTLTQQDAGTLTATVTLAPFTTTDLTEGTNLYFTTARARQSLSAGTGITYNNSTGVITNDAPDQVVAVTAGTGISVTGTYPNFTITNTSPSSGGTVTGSGTTNYLSKWTSASALGDSLVFDNGTNVGIGTATPSTKLEVGGSAKITGGGWPTAGAGLELNYGSNTSYVGSYDRTNSVYKNLFLFANDITFETNASIRMYIATGGNVGINNTSPNGALSFADDVNTRKIVLWDGAANNNYQFYGFGVESSTFINSIYDTADRFLWVAGSGSTSRSEVMVLTGTGSLGIGTTAPTEKLVVTGAIRSTNQSNNFSTGGVSAFMDIINASKLVRIGSVTGGDTLSGSEGDVGIFTRGNEVVRITAAGNIGIGTTSPNTPLSTSRGIVINSGASNDVQIRMQNNNTGSTGSDGGLLSISNLQMYLWNYENSTLIFGTNNAERMRITADGSLLVGATNPDVGGSVKGTIIREDGSIVAARNIASPFHYQTPISADRMNTMGDGIMYSMWRQGVFQAGIGATNASNMTFFTGDNSSASERMRITSSGALLVGTTSTTNTASGKIVNLTVGSSSPDLSLNGGAWSIASIGAEPALYLSSNIVAATGLPSATQTAKGGIGFEYSNAAAPTDLVLGIFGSPTVSSSVRIFNNTERIRIASTGATRLNAYGSGSFTGTVAYNLAVDSGGNIIETAGGVVDGSGTANYVSKWSDANTLTDSVIYDNGTNVGIGNSNPGSLLQVGNAGAAPTGLATLTLTGANTAPQIATKPGLYHRHAVGLGVFSDYAMSFQVNGSSALSDAMYITNTGNVGIGTTDPNYKLHVRGTGITAGAISTGWPSFTAESAAQSKVTGYFTAGGNGDVSTAGQGASSVVMLGEYYDARGIITMIGAGGSSPSDQGTGYGKDLMVKAGNSDNTNGYVGGRLFLAGGSGYSGGAYGSNYGAVSLQPQGGNVGIGTTAPGAKLEVVGDTYLRTQVFTDTIRPYTGNQLQLLNGGSNTLFINGNVGIGTTAPGNKLAILAPDTTGVPTLGTNQGHFGIFNGTGAGSYGLLAGIINNGNAYLQVQRIDGTATAYNMLLQPSGGNVGIGTTSPTLGLHVADGNGLLVGPSSASGSMYVSPQDENTINGSYGIASDTADIWLNYRGYQDGWSYFRDTRIGNGKGTAITYWNGDTGNMMIGTTTDSGAKLRVYGGYMTVEGTNTVMYIESNYAGGNGLDAGTLISAGGTNSNIIIIPSGGGVAGSKVVGSAYNGSAWRSMLEYANVSSGEPVLSLVRTAGNVGIGTTSPTEKLHVDGNAVLTYNNSYQGINSIGNKAILARVSPTTGIINYAEYATAANLNGFVMGSDDARVKGNIATDSLEFITNGSTQVTVLSNGNVGIANTNPSEKLSVTGNIRMDNGAADGPQLVLGSSGFSDWNIDNFSGSLRAYYGSTEYTRLTSSGNFGIGVSPSYKLDVAGDTRITSGSLGVGVVPNATDGRIDASNDIVAYSSSDRRLKENITPIANALDKVKSLTGVEFDWKPEHKKAHGYEGHDTGVIAQEVQEVMPTAVRTNDTGYLAVRYEKLIGLLIEANKELAARVEELEKKLK